jgi:hypothetical protein
VLTRSPSKLCQNECHAVDALVMYWSSLIYAYVCSLGLAKAMPLSCPDETSAAHRGAEARKQVTSLSLSRIAHRDPRSAQSHCVHPDKPFLSSSRPLRTIALLKDSYACRLRSALAYFYQHAASGDRDGLRRRVVRVGGYHHKTTADAPPAISTPSRRPSPSQMMWWMSKIPERAHRPRGR